MDLAQVRLYTGPVRKWQSLDFRVTAYLGIRQWYLISVWKLGIAFENTMQPIWSWETLTLLGWRLL